MKRFLLILSLATATTLSAQTKKKSNTKPATPAPRLTINSAAPVGIESSMPDTSVTTAPEPTIYTNVDGMPVAGYNFNEYLIHNLRYPANAIKQRAQGRVAVQFIVNEDGSITDVAIKRGVSKDCDEEALRVIKSMPRWIPGKQNGKIVRVLYTQPISFRLE